MSAWLLAAMIAAQSLDISTTVIALHRGCQEQTYYISNPAGIVAMKGGATATLTFTLPIGAKRGHQKLSKGIAWVMIGSGVLGGTLNLRTLPRCHR